MKKFLLFGLVAAVLPALAEEAADRKTATSLKYVTHELDTRQDKFTAETNKAMEYTNSAGAVEKRTVKSDLGSDTTDTSLPMVGGVNTKLNQKQDDIDPVNDHTAVTYTGQPGGIGRKGIYQTTESYEEQSDNLIDAKTFNAALKNGLDSEFICSEFKPDTNLCWVYSIHNTTTTALPTGYSQLEYIETDGNVVLNTQHMVQADDVLELHYKMLPANISKQGDKMLLYGSSTWAETFDSANTWYTRFLSNSSVFGNSNESQYQGVLILKKNALIVNGVQILSPTFGTNSGTLPLYLFGRNNVTGTSIVQSTGFKITNNGQIIMNMVPARHNSDGEVGMYDTVSEQFFPKTGDGTFIAGPEVNVYIPQNQTN